MNWDDLRLFMLIAQECSIRKAANRLEISHSTLSRRLESLETHLSTKLFYRHSSGLVLTESGVELFSEIKPVFTKIERVLRNLSGRDQSQRGEIKVTLPCMFAKHLLFDDLIDFQESWPEISMQIHASDDIVDLEKGMADVAIRLTENPDESLIGRKLGDLYQAAYATEEYIQSSNSDVEREIKWLKPGPTTKVESINLNFIQRRMNECSLVINNIDLQLQAAEMHKGIALLPCFMGDRNKKLIRVSEPYKHFSIWMLYPKESRDNKRMLLFRQYIVKCIENHAELLQGKNPSAAYASSFRPLLDTG
ncbi:MAG TPA: LysR family transcriptional regulator [Gammaproteobacteria bacterium]|nr:LysR family transcriptional regulator [Gammaproteobacteria bacterium]